MIANKINKKYFVNLQMIWEYVTYSIFLKQNYMENSTLLGLTGKIVSKEVIDKNQAAFEFLDKYKKTINIIERTSVALGKKLVYKSTSGTSINGNLNLNSIGKTH